MDAGDTFDVVPADVAPSKRDPRWMVVAGLLLVAVAMVGGLLVIGGGSDEDDDQRARPPESSMPSTTADPEDPASVLELMPAGPLDGKESWRLPVLVVPQSDVTDGQIVTALGRGFLPGERVGVVMCASAAATEGVAACSLATSTSPYGYVTYANADQQGDVRSPLRLRQNIDTPATGPIDCASAPERCLVAIGAVDDYDRSGGSFVNFQGAPAFAPPGMLVEPAGPYVPAQVVRVGAAGLIPTRDVELVQCLGDVCVLLHRGQVGDDGTFSASGAVEPVLTSPDGGPLPCATSCVLRVQGTGLRGASAAPMPADIPTAFVDEVLAPPATETVAPPPDPTVTETVAPPPDPTPEPTVTAPGTTPTETLTPMSTTTSEIPSTSTTGPPPTPLPTTVLDVDEEEIGPPTVESLVSTSALVVTGTVESVESIGTPQREEDPFASEYVAITVRPDQLLLGNDPGSIVIAWEAFVTDGQGTRTLEVLTNGIRTPQAGDELLLFLAVEDPARIEQFGSTYRPTVLDGFMTLSDGVVTGGEEGSPVVRELIGLTVDEVAQRIGG